MNSVNLIMASLMLLIISVIYYIYIAIVLLATFAIEND